MLVMIDFTAAFETIDHDILLSRLFHRFEVTGAALEWFQSYLSGRHQVGRIGNEKSQFNDVMFGVPQGSVLGLLLCTTLYYTSRRHYQEMRPRFPPLRRGHIVVCFLRSWGK